jgi:16S rRNA (guanine966-N2)-methyltransferase
MIKIISGAYKNCVISKFKNSKYRPTTSRLKEAIFSILESSEFKQYNIFSNQTALLDLFCGSGSLGFEAISRGAKFVTFIDINKENLYYIKKSAESLSILNDCKILNLSSLKLPEATMQYDLVFIDPPYHKNLAYLSICELIDKSWLKNNSLLVVELAKTDDFSIEDLTSINIIKSRIYGNSKLIILKFTQV